MLIQILKAVRFLGRQGLALRGDGDEKIDLNLVNLHRLSVFGRFIT